MGMYTEIHLKVKLSPNLPENIIFAFQHDEEADKKNLLPAHKFFQTEHWQSLCYINGSEEKIFIDHKCEFVLANPLTLEKHSGYWLLSVSTSFKNYDNEIEKLLDLLSQYVIEEDGKVLGQTCYESEDRMCQLIKYKNKNLFLDSVIFEQAYNGYPTNR